MLPALRHECVPVQLARTERRPLAAFWVHKELQRLLAAEEADRLRLWDLGAG